VLDVVTILTELSYTPGPLADTGNASEFLTGNDLVLVLLKVIKNPNSSTSGHSRPVPVKLDTGPVNKSYRSVERLRRRSLAFPAHSRQLSEQPCGPLDPAARAREIFILAGFFHTLQTVLKLVDVFAGCGGMTSGFCKARSYSFGNARLFDPIFAVEHEPHAAETYVANFGTHVDTRSIEVIPNDDFPRADVLIGGPPCQGFSALNRQKVGDVRRQLWREYERALHATEAEYFVMENVPQLLGSLEYEDFSTRARAQGWDVRESVVNAADYGVPQIRRRAIVIGSLRGPAPMPSMTHSRKPAEAVEDGVPRLCPWVTVRDAIGALPAEPDGHLWHRSRRPTATSLARYARVPRDGGNRFEMQAALDAEGLGHLVPPCWRNKPYGTTDVFGRMRWDMPAPTIRTEFYKPEKGRYLHPEHDRPITVREGALLMGFDLRKFTLPEDQALTHIGRQVGNAVPPPLAERVALAIAEDALSAVGNRPTALAA
jgi:DNA (cytosine-5)-methyltransferase 1